MKNKQIKRPNITCKCGEKVPFLYYCTECRMINFGKRKIIAYE